MAPLEIGTLYYVEEAIYKAEKAVHWMVRVGEVSITSPMETYDMQTQTSIVWNIYAYSVIGCTYFFHIFATDSTASFAQGIGHSKVCRPLYPDEEI